MSAPVSHHPLVVNTQDGTCWTRRAVTRDGRGLYALAGSVAGVPDEVLVSLAELAELGITGSAFALPVPVGSEPSPLERMQLRVDEVERKYIFDTAALKRRIAELEAERHVTNEALSDAAEALRANRDRIVELEALLRLRSTQRGDVARLIEVAGGLGEECVDVDELKSAISLSADEPADKLTALFAPTQALREDAPLKGRARLDASAAAAAEVTHWARLGIEDPHDSPLHRDYRVGHDLPETGGR